MNTWRFGGLALAFVLGACQASSGPAAGAVDLASAGNSLQSDLQLVSRLPAPVGTNQGRDVPIARDDLLKIDVFQVDELDRTVRVDSNGRISLALIGMVDAAGKTVPELEHDIEKIYGVKYLQNPEVSVFVQESAGQQVTVNGAVRSPGIYPISSTATLLQVIAQAGDLAEIADTSKVYVFREVGNGKFVANFDIGEIRSGQRPDPRIFGGDVVVSFSSGTKIAMKNLREALGMATNVARIATF